MVGALVIGILLVFGHSLRHALRVIWPDIVKVGNATCLMKDGWGVDADLTSNGVRFLLISRTNPTLPLAKKKKIQLIQNLPIALKPIPPSVRATMFVEPLGQVEYGEIASFSAQARIGQISSARYLGVFPDGVMYFESLDDVRSGFCARATI